MSTDFMKHVREAQMFPEWIEDLLDQMSSEEKQEQAAHEIQPTLEEAVKGLIDRIEHPQGKFLYKSGNGDAPTGRVKQAIHGIEKAAAWDMFSKVDEEMAVRMPRYRYLRQAFSVCCSFFSVEWVLIAMVLVLALFFSVRWTYRHVEAVIARSEATKQSKTPNGEIAPTASQGLAVGAALTPEGRPGATGASGTLAMTSAPTVPQIIEQTFIVGHKLRLRWNPMGPGYAYRIYRSYVGQEPAAPLNDGQLIHGVGAIIDLYPGGSQDTWLSVTAVDANGIETKPSEPVHFQFTAMNQNNMVEPIAEEPNTESVDRGVGSVDLKVPPNPKSHVQNRKLAVSQNASPNQSVPVQKPSFASSLTNQLLKNADGTITSGLVRHPLVSQSLIAGKNAVVTASERAAPTAAIPVPTSVHADINSPTDIDVSWSDLGAGYTYNAYSDVTDAMMSPWKENEQPLHQAHAHWQPERGLSFYWLAICAVDKNGQEGKMSEPIYVKVR